MGVKRIGMIKKQASRGILDLEEDSSSEEDDGCGCGDGKGDSQTEVEDVAVLGRDGEEVIRGAVDDGGGHGGRGLELSVGRRRL